MIHAGGVDGIGSDGSIPGGYYGGRAGGETNALAPGTQIPGTVVAIGYIPVSVSNHTVTVLTDINTGKQIMTRAGDTMDGGPKRLQVTGPTYWTELSIDKPSEVVAYQTVGILSQPISNVISYTRNVADAVNSANISYGNLIGRNSNGFTASYLNWLGIQTPQLNYGAWGFSYPLPIPRPIPSPKPPNG